MKRSFIFTFHVNHQLLQTLASSDTNCVSRWEYIHYVLRVLKPNFWLRSAGQRQSNMSKSFTLSAFAGITELVLMVNLCYCGALLFVLLVLPAIVVQKVAESHREFFAMRSRIRGARSS